jgi:uncharacterized protein involved in exopolysaccharide biosynthesis
MAEREADRATDVDLFRKFWRRRRLVAISGLLGMVLGVGIELIRDPVYYSRITIMPESSTPVGRGSLGRLASTLGTSFDQETNLETLYPDIVESNYLVDRVLATEFPAPAGSGNESLARILNPDGKSTREELRQFMQESVLATKLDDKTGLITVRVGLPSYRELSAPVTESVVSELDAFVRVYHQQRALRKRESLQLQLAQAESSLAAVEDELTDFLAANHRFQDSPELNLTFTRLSRRESLQNQIWLELRLRYEAALTEESDNSRGLTILDSATTAKSERLKSVAIAGLVGLLLGACLALAYIWSRIVVEFSREF